MVMLTEGFKCLKNKVEVTFPQFSCSVDFYCMYISIKTQLVKLSKHHNTACCNFIS